MTQGESALFERIWLVGTLVKPQRLIEGYRDFRPFGVGMTLRIGFIESFCYQPIHQQSFELSIDQRLSYPKNEDPLLRYRNYVN